MKRIGEESLVGQRFPRGLKEMDRCELGAQGRESCNLYLGGRPVVMSRKLSTRGSGLRIIKLDNHQVSSGAGNRGINERVCTLNSLPSAFSTANVKAPATWYSFCPGHMGITWAFMVRGSLKTTAS